MHALIILQPLTVDDKVVWGPLNCDCVFVGSPSCLHSNFSHSQKQISLANVKISASNDMIKTTWYTKNVHQNGHGWLGQKILTLPPEHFRNFWPAGIFRAELTEKEKTSCEHQGDLPVDARATEAKISSWGM